MVTHVLVHVDRDKMAGNGFEPLHGRREMEAEVGVIRRERRGGRREKKRDQAKSTRKQDENK